MTSMTGMRAMRYARGGLATLVAAVALAVGTAEARQAQSPTNTGCVRCHLGLGDVRLSSPAKLEPGDVHGSRGFSCVQCHGGDPTTDDPARAMGAARGFTGAPAGEAIIATCAHCHSDAAFMRGYAPRERVDQAAEYRTSVHGQRLAKGDTKVATCVSCHGAHGIRRVSDAESPVFPLNVATTCARCHADADRMKGYVGANGEPLPTDEYAEYVKSIHYQTLTKGNDLSAPTCNDCHGNHGAAPPGVQSVANVCGTCHAVFENRFVKSAHAQLFTCTQCHSNHDVQPVSDAMLGTQAPAVCVECHGQGDNGFVAAHDMRAGIDALKNALGVSDALIGRATNAGMELGDQSLALDQARNQLALARVTVHAFDAAQVQQVVQTGLDITKQVDVAGDAALAEVRFRRVGLAASLLAILVVVVALGLKVRDIDRRRGVKG
jgi:predicted CXXCH cytochrome family protein